MAEITCGKQKGKVVVLEFGADQGVALYEALDAAADRNVSIRCASWLTTCMISGY